MPVPGPRWPWRIREYISNNIRLILDLIDYKEFITDNSCILFVDFFKAFDTIDHNFMLETLIFFGFGEYFLKAIQTLYNDCNSPIKLSHGTTSRFKINRGIRQGCPISPFLFLLVTQTMAIHIKRDTFCGIKILEKELKCSQLADDTAIKKNETEIKKAIDCLNIFSSVSGVCLNINKCVLFPLKICNYNNILGIPVKEMVDYLGIRSVKIKRREII